MWPFGSGSIRIQSIPPCLHGGVRPAAGGWWALQDSNLQPTDYESAALTIVLRAQKTGDRPAWHQFSPPIRYYNSPVKPPQPRAVQ